VLVRSVVEEEVENAGVVRVQKVLGMGIVNTQSDQDVNSSEVVAELAESKQFPRASPHWWKLELYPQRTRNAQCHPSSIVNYPIEDEGAKAIKQATSQNWE
jgi:hypothetical protein